MKTLLNKTGITCTGCAKGGLFTSFVGRANHFKYGEIEDDNQLISSEHIKLLEIFSARQLSLIETAFEGSQYLEEYEGKSISFSQKEYDRAVDFNMDYDDSDERLIAICQNIIDNKGTFKP